MADIVTILLLFLAYFVSIVGATTYSELRRFEIQDETRNENYEQGKFEYHCFDIVDGVRTYVRGTYGMYGYFEGSPADASNPHVFFINWYESIASEFIPGSGTARIVYNSAFNNVTGHYWYTASSDVKLDSNFGHWHASDGSYLAKDTDVNGEAKMLTRCLYPGITFAKKRSEIKQIGDGVTAYTGVSEQGINTFCVMPAGGAGPAQWLGTYRYIGSEEEGSYIEYGNSGINSFGFSMKSGLGFIGSWHASTAKYNGTYGPCLYGVVADGIGAMMVGFYCIIDFDTLERLECSNEYYNLLARDTNFGNCPAYYDFDGSMDPLFRFASIGSDMSDSTDNKENQRKKYAELVLAIFFGCLSAVLLCLLLLPDQYNHLFWSRGQAKYSAVYAKH
jgi:hypothetical protein